MSTYKPTTNDTTQTGGPMGQHGAGTSSSDQRFAQEATHKAQDMAAKASAQAEDLSHKAESLAAQGKAKVDEWSAQARDTLNEYCDTTATYVRQKPITSLLIAAAAGAVVAMCCKTTTHYRRH